MKDTSLRFARHETFYPRYGWLKKVYEYVQKEKDLYLENIVADILYSNTPLLLQSIPYRASYDKRASRSTTQLYKISVGSIL